MCEFSPYCSIHGPADPPLCLLDAVQLAKLAGYTVIATASPKNEALIKSLGADAVYPCETFRALPFRRR